MAQDLAQSAVRDGSLSPARGLARFVHDMKLADVPATVRERAKDLMLDAIGCALAANTYPFAARALAGGQALGGSGRSTVIGRPERLPLRDAVLVNGVLLHGLDFDDSHLTAIIHPTVTCLPAALGVAEERGMSGEDMLAAYIAGMESAIRIGASVKGGFHHVGFHATGVITHFAAALVAGRLMGLAPDALVSAQGIAASTAGAVQVFLEEGAWTKRLHPGWGTTAGITAATLAANGFFGPSRPYEGRFGLFETHLQEHAAHADIAIITAGLGDDWELPRTSIKPYPVCHFIHGAAEAAIEIHKRLKPTADDLAEVRVAIPGPTLPIVAEPVEIKTRPANEYDAKFSAQYVVATCLLKGRFGLADLSDAAMKDEHVLSLTRRIVCEADPASGYPTFMSGGVSVRTTAGQTVEQHIPVNLGAGDRGLDRAGIERKFFANAALHVSRDAAERIRDRVLELDRIAAVDLAAALSIPASCSVHS
ncbi:MAG: MmgE/PrpD family protein [Hyphomicrobiaceae bacterium]